MIYCILVIVIEQHVADSESTPVDVVMIQQMLLFLY